MATPAHEDRYNGEAPVIETEQAADIIIKTEHVESQCEDVQNTAYSQEDGTCLQEAGSEIEPSVPTIKLHTKFSSFLELQGAIERYQKEKSVQLIVKDSKLLKSESTRKVIPKVYHLVNQALMYHSITYICKCHGEKRQKSNTRIKKVGKKRLNCPMYIRFKLSQCLQKLVLYDLHEEHNHGVDPTTCQMTPRQQVYQLSRLKRSRVIEETNNNAESEAVYTVVHLSSRLEADGNDKDQERPEKSARLEENITQSDEVSQPKHGNESENRATEQPSCERDDDLSSCNPFSDTDSSSDSSDDDCLPGGFSFLPLPLRLIGSTVARHPELIASARSLLESKNRLLEAKAKLIELQMANVELQKGKLELELKKLHQKVETGASSIHQQDTTSFYF